MKTYDFHGPTPQGPAGRNQQSFLLGMMFHENGIRGGTTAYDPDGRPISALCPMVVCYAFAAELYLKSLISKPIRGHELNTLYKAVPGPLRSAIASIYLKRTGRNQAALRADLDAMSNAFAEWRYVFESDGQQLQFNLLNAFTRSVFEVAHSNRPAWHVSKDREDHLLADSDNPIMTIKNLGGGTFIHIVDGTGGTLNIPEA